ncbi:GTP-binding protein, partial [Cardiosporidium cionae]
LEAVGIRLNKKRPDIYFRVKTGGGLTVNSTVPLTHVDPRLIRLVLNEYKIFNADVLFREDCTVDDFIDEVEGNRKYCKCLYIYNKADMLSLRQLDELARRPMTVVVSCQKGWNVDILKESIWEQLEIVRVYTKRRSEFPDFEKPLVLTPQRGKFDLIDLLKDFKHAIVWGRSAKHSPQHVGL